MAWQLNLLARCNQEPKRSFQRLVTEAALHLPDLYYYTTIIPTTTSTSFSNTKEPNLC